jgi:uncharacterized membrane protein
MSYDNQDTDIRPPSSTIKFFILVTFISVCFFYFLYASFFSENENKTANEKFSRMEEIKKEMKVNSSIIREKLKKNAILENEIISHGRDIK